MGNYGHVAYVENVSGSTFSTSKMYDGYGCTVFNKSRSISSASGFIFPSGTGGGGSGDELDLNVKKVEITISGQDKWSHEISLEPSQIFDIKAKVENKGEDNAKDIDIKYYISDSKNFSKNNDQYFGKEHIIELDEEEDRNEYERTITTPLSEGVFYVFVYIDYDGDEENKSNSYSSETDTEEYAKLSIQRSNQIPLRAFDEATCAQISGWARDPDTLNSINVHLYADVPAGSGSFIGSVSNQFKNDLPSRDKNHGFSFEIPDSLKDGNSHFIYVYAIDSGGGHNPQLTHSPQTINKCIDVKKVVAIVSIYIITSSIESSKDSDSDGIPDNIEEKNLYRRQRS